MTMGPYGIHYERTTTWWDRSDAWIAYLTRCQFLLQRGLPVADVLFLEPEASPQVFQAPASATKGNPPSRLGYNFDGCTPDALLTRATVRDGRIVLPDGMGYRLLVLPRTPAMTPRLLAKVEELVEAGATAVGTRPLRSPGLSGYPACDAVVKQLADALWGEGPAPEGIAERRVGDGRVITGRGLEGSNLFPDFGILVDIFKKAKVPPDFEADRDLRFAHRRDGDAEIYFVANGQQAAVRAECAFRVAGKCRALGSGHPGDPTGVDIPPGRRPHVDPPGVRTERFAVCGLPGTDSGVEDGGTERTAIRDTLDARRSLDGAVRPEGGRTNVAGRVHGSD